MDFNGSQVVIISGNNIIQNLGKIDNSFTISFWVYSKEKINERDGWFQFSRSGGTHEFVLNLMSDNQFRLITWKDDGATLVNVNRSIIGNWRLISLSYDREKIKIYYDDEKIIDKASQNVEYDFAGNTLLGMYSYDNNYSSSYIDDIRIYSRALTASEIQTLYVQTKDKYLAEEL